MWSLDHARIKRLELGIKIMHLAFVIYAIEGAALFLTNALFAIAIARSHRLVVKYYILFAKFITDALSGLAALSSGVGRLIIIETGIEQLRSGRFCMLMPWNILFSW
ncbi:unnamed protein product [Toxocara canis]|uniref:G_PROTEIN_RECEP_F1_2 domain-containing protein n=1 Tax=Toxocara canis TaxID=6265 RepID=A0A183V390_TOXCA|nr:unnamed protein product [Toxocara canis]